MQKHLWQLLLLLVAGVLCVGFISCDGDDDEDENGTSTSNNNGKRLWYLYYQLALDRDQSPIYEYVYDYYDDGKVRTMSCSKRGDIDDFSAPDADFPSRIHYEYSANTITTSSRNIKCVCQLESGRISRIDFQENYYYAFEYDKQGRLIRMNHVYYDNTLSSFNISVPVTWEGDELISCQYYNVVSKSYKTDYSIIPSEVENARCDAQFSPLMYVIGRFTEGTINAVVRIDQVIHPLEAYFGKKPAHLIGSILHHKEILGNDEPIIDTKTSYTYTVSGGYVQGVDYVVKNSPYGIQDETAGLGGRYRTLVWK